MTIFARYKTAMTIMEGYGWAEQMEGCAITVCDTEGTIIYMNERSRRTFGKDGASMVGQNMMPCHNERSQAMIRKMLSEGSTHCYTISKHGQKKMIFQTPWKENGEVRGLVEISMVIPEEMPHYDRG